MPRPMSDPSPPPIRRAGRGARPALLRAVLRGAGLLGVALLGAGLLGGPGRGLEAGGIEAAPGSAFDRARKAAAGKDAAAALPLYFAALRETDEYAVKYAIRDEILALPPVAAEPLSERERATVAARIAEERERDVEKKAEGFEGKGKVKAAYLLRDRLRTLEGITTEKAEQIKATLERMQHAICDEATDDEKAQAKVQEGDPKDVEGAFKRAERAAVEGRGRVALRIYRSIGYSGLASQELKDRAKAAVDALRAAMVAEMAPSEKADAELVWEDPHWKGLATSVSHQFVFIGAKDFVETITPADRIRVDLACQLLGDLLGRDLAAGERLTIYYKERFDFGGGLGGGKRIDIGNKAIAKPIAGGLHYHELSHCAFDVGMIYPGFVEGIANFGATFVLDALGRAAEADDAIRSNRQGWQDDYLDRRMRYFRIQSYAPSCGFLFLPITAKDAVARQAEWAKYRTFFRRLRRELPQEPRDAERIRYFAWVWGDVFGWRLLDEAASARFPVVPQDKDRVGAEIAKWYELTARGERDAQQGFVGASIEPLEAVLKGCPAGELHDRASFAMALAKDGLGETDARDALYRELGVVPAWKLCLPFYERGASPLYAVHEPERGIDLAATYPNPAQAARWMDAKVAPDGRVDLLEYGVGYPDDAAAYALAYLEVPADVPEATCLLGFDDTCAAWLDGELLEKWDDATEWIRDHHAVSFPLAKGRHRLLLKVVNRRGPWGFSARVVRADRAPIEGLVFAKPPSTDDPPVTTDPKGKAVYAFELGKGKTFSKTRFKVTAGSWDADGGALHRGSPGNVAWRKFTVSPFVTKDPPSGLIWLQDKELAGLGDFALEIGVKLPSAGYPKVAVTLHGEEKDDGLSGHTFLVSPSGDGVEVRLEEYDRLVYRGVRTLGRVDEHTLRFVRRGRTLSCLVDGVPVLDRVDLPPLARSGIGLMTWDKETGFTRIKVERLGGK